MGKEHVKRALSSKNPEPPLTTEAIIAIKSSG
jgi:hypothetical protein